MAETLRGDSPTLISSLSTVSRKNISRTEGSRDLPCSRVSLCLRTSWSQQDPAPQNPWVLPAAPITFFPVPTAFFARAWGILLPGRVQAALPSTTPSISPTLCHLGWEMAPGWAGKGKRKSSSRRGSEKEGAGLNQPITPHHLLHQLVVLSRWVCACEQPLWVRKYTQVR